MEWNSPVVFKTLKTVDGNDVPEHRAVTEESTGNVLGIVSDRYKILPNKKLYEAIKPVTLELGFNEERISCTNGGKRTFFKFYGNGENKLELDPGDIVNFGVEFFNSYDRSLQAGYHVIAMRLVCTNGLVAPKSISTFQIRHIGRITPDLIRNRFVGLGDKIKETTNQWREWTRIPVSESNAEEILKKIVGKERIVEGLTKNYKRLKPEYRNAWGLYNILTYYLSHDLKSHKGKEDNLDYKRFTLGERWTERLVNIIKN